MHVLRDPGLVELSSQEWGAIFPILESIGYRWCKGVKHLEPYDDPRLWEPKGIRCVGQLTREGLYYVETSYLVDVLPILLARG